MIDWEFAIVVAFTGIISVFLVLGILFIAVTINGNVINYLDQRKSEAQRNKAMPG